MLWQSFDFPTNTLLLEQPLIKDKKLMTLRSQRKNRDVNWELDVNEAKNSIKKKGWRKRICWECIVFLGIWIVSLDIWVKFGINKC